MPEESNGTVYSVTKKIVTKLTNQLDTSAGKAMLARLRHSAGKPISEAKEVWPILFENLPETFLSQYDDASYEETAILTAIQLYALYQQGRAQSVFDEVAEKHQNIGYSLKNLRREEDTIAVDRRFNTMITATTFDELTHHLRHLVTLLKAKSPETKIDFARLSADLYWFLRDYPETVRLNWARQYYKHSSKEEEENDN
ncbi:type I-E CRISPR-associated protein Cse2/CasB [Streptococcus ratti]|uniref:CRISPR-associated protein n=1 Tax=Streptococcus ratti FA-1 = DSM 20564 TaxID=699248 RepID=A0ABP2QYS4_STRRT|nr:type I-E CRISPR-associated protein Cse2/CasB [Streptococcus ratti]EJN94200.1 CRISPR-associated protein [Streptococcus ratti FA-1 = DSM 20564]EMP69812.1 hypothetical protein D822_06548 [Streptococcus ratti FA-1 = DSM 20564]QEY08016.1 type I-E CRISPR-associated protein Cse2/CasB [Streptococcus ratti]VEI60496.1 CRISPR-associated Cse2 family protein [Streptococcus mutans]